MNVSLDINLFCSFIVLSLGIYVFKSSVVKPPYVRSYFFALSTVLSIWVFASGIRYFIPDSLRPIAPNWTLISVTLAPFLMNRLTNFIIDEKYRPSRFRKSFDIVLVGYLVLSCLFLKTIEVKNYDTSVYKTYFAYHILIFYSILYVGNSIYLMYKKAWNSRGAVRVRFTLLLLGTSVGLLVSILFVYILPFFGISKGYLSSLGLIPSTLFWAVAILQYDAFQTRAMVLRSHFIAKRQLPLLSRLTFKPVLALHYLMDPLDYRLQLRNSRVEVVNYIMQYYMVFQKSSEMKHRSQIRKITSFIERFMK
ncbi:hypothetical protein JWG44_09915 [Leptospira sp. 201903071]|uniref:LIC10906 family membrane protein n=1 Tax=Leptospira ainazelensis TaxID=2810034 RepID=UPI0019630C46|nr:hypothetical protein [Leptospira ainazelensis]